MIIFRLKRKLFGVATINNLEEFLGGGDSKHGGHIPDEVSNGLLNY